MNHNEDALILCYIHKSRKNIDRTVIHRAISEKVPISLLISEATHSFFTKSIDDNAKCQINYYYTASTNDFVSASGTFRPTRMVTLCSLVSSVTIGILTDLLFRDFFSTIFVVYLQVLAWKFAYTISNVYCATPGMTEQISEEYRLRNHMSWDCKAKYSSFT